MGDIGFEEAERRRLRRAAASVRLGARPRLTHLASGGELYTALMRRARQKQPR